MPRCYECQVHPRGISFEQIVVAIEDGSIADILEHPNAERYPNQRVSLVVHEDYVFAQAIAVAQATLKKDRRMNVRISDGDLEGLKARAAEEGIPYQTLVTMVLHKYVAGRFVEKTTTNK